MEEYYNIGDIIKIDTGYLYEVFLPGFSIDAMCRDHHTNRPYWMGEYDVAMLVQNHGGAKLSKAEMFQLKLEE